MFFLQFRTNDFRTNCEKKMKLRKVKRNVRKWLDQMGLKYEPNKENDDEYLLIQGYMEKRFFIKILCSEDWIYTYCLVLGAEMIPDYKRFHLYTEILLQNKFKPDLTYSIDKKGNVYSENDSPAETNFEAFKSEYEAAIKGIKIILDEVCPKIELDVSDTVMVKMEVKE